MPALANILLPTAQNIIADPESWSTGGATCNACGETIENESEHFWVQREDELYIDFHYGCAVIESHVEAFQEAEIKGWMS